MADNDTDGKAPEPETAPEAPETEAPAEDAADSPAPAADAKAKGKGGPNVGTNTRHKLGEQRKRIRQREFPDSSMGWDKILAFGIPILLLVLGLGGWKYHQSGEPERSLAAWYEQFREATRAKDGKAMAQLYGVGPKRDLMGAFNLHLIRQRMGEESYQEALAEPRIRRIEADEQADFETFLGKLIEAGKIGIDKEPQGFNITHEGAIGTVKVEGPDLRAERTKDGLWHFIEFRKAIPKGKVHRKEKDDGGKSE